MLTLVERRREGFSTHDITVAMRRSLLSEPTGDDAIVISLLNAAFDFRTFATMMESKHNDDKRAADAKKRAKMAKYHAAGGKKHDKKHDVSHLA